MSLANMKVEDLAQNLPQIREQLARGWKMVGSKQLIMLLIASILAWYQIGVNTFLVGPMTKLGQVNDLISKQEDDARTAQQQQAEFQQQAERYKAMKQVLITIEEGSSPEVAAVAKAEQLADVFRYKRDGVLTMALSPEMAQRELVSLNPLGPGKITDLVKLPPAGSTEAPVGLQNGAEEGEGAAGSYKAWRYEYELKATGTLAGLMSFINELVASRQLIVIDKLTFSSGALAKEKIAEILKNNTTTPVADPSPSVPQGTQKTLNKLLAGLPGYPNPGERPNGSANKPEPLPIRMGESVTTPLEMTLQFSLLIEDPSLPQDNGGAEAGNAPDPGGATAMAMP